MRKIGSVLTGIALAGALIMFTRGIPATAADDIKTKTPVAYAPP